MIPPVPRSWALAAGFIAAACSAGPEASELGLDVDLHPIDVVALEDSDSVFVGLIRQEAAVAVAPDGRIAVADLRPPQVVVFESDGSLHQVAGAEGEGPGEFQTPYAVAWDPAGRLWVAEYVSLRVTVFGRDLEVERIFPLRGPAFATAVQPSFDRMVFAVNYAVMGRDSFEADMLRTYPFDGSSEIRSFMGIDSRALFPYVGGQYEPVLRVAGDSVFGASNLGYPVEIYTLEGEQIGSFGAPPPSFAPVSYPEYGEFAADPMGGQAWLRSFSRITSIRVLHDSLVAVEHHRLDPEVMTREEPRFLIDLYDRRSLEKIAEDVAVPGRIMDSDGERLWVLGEEPPGSWTLTAFELTFRQRGLD